MSSFAAVVLTVLALGGSASADQATPQRTPKLRAIHVAPARNLSPLRVTIEADGPLPVPVTGTLDGPPRIYLDFRDVRPDVAVPVDGSDPAIRRVRFAINTLTPLTTRVVIDLEDRHAYRLDTANLAGGLLEVVIGDSPVGRRGGEPAKPPAARRATPVAPPAPARSPGAGASDAYAAAVKVVLDRLTAQRKILTSLDQRTAVPPPELTSAATEFEALARMLDAIKPPASRQSTHALLQRVCALGSRAAHLAEDAQTVESAAWNAASAAAGALLFLDQAAGELADPASKKP